MLRPWLASCVWRADARKSLTLLEAAAGVASEVGSGEISVESVEAAANQALVRWGKDQHYDVASAFIKSMRGSDVDASIHYLARMIEAGRTRATSPGAS